MEKRTDFLHRSEIMDVDIKHDHNIMIQILSENSTFRFIVKELNVDFQSKLIEIE